MAYSTRIFQGKQLTVVDIFSPNYHQSITQVASFLLVYGLVPSFILLSVFHFFIYRTARSYWRFHLENLEIGTRLAALISQFVLILKKVSPTMFWNLYLRLVYWELFDATLTDFGDDYAQAWRE